MAERQASLQQHQQKLYLLLEEFDRVCKELNIPYILFAGTMLGAVRHQGFIPWDDDLDVVMLRKDYERFLREADAVLDQKIFYLQKEFTEHWPMFFSKLRLNGTTCLEKYHAKDPHMHQGVYIDIFPCDDAASTEFGRRLQYLASKVVITKSVDRRGYDTNSTAKKIAMVVARVLPMKLFRKLTCKGDPNSGKVHTFLGGGKAYRQNVYPRAYFEERTLGQFEGKNYPIAKDYDGLLTMLYGDYMELPPEEKRAIKQHAVLVDLENSWENYTHYLDDVKFDVYTRSIR